MRALLGLLCSIVPLLSLETGESDVSFPLSSPGRAEGEPMTGLLAQSFSFPFSVTARTWTLLAPELSIRTSFSASSPLCAWYLGKLRPVRLRAQGLVSRFGIRAPV